MKAFIIHTYHNISIEYANRALESFNGYFGWEPELFEGMTIETLLKYEKKYSLELKPRSRATDFFNKNLGLYKVKKCCAMNQYRLLRRCVNLNETIAIIEHDSHCIGDWLDYKFDDILVMNPYSAIRQKVFAHILRFNTTPIEAGIHDINFNRLNYRHDPELKRARMMPGLAAYAVTPAGAQKMIDVFENVGWEQGDQIINTAYVRIQTLMPELFTFILPNLSMSHGENM